MIHPRDMCKSSLMVVTTTPLDVALSSSNVLQQLPQIPKNVDLFSYMHAPFMDHLFQVDMSLRPPQHMCHVTTFTPQKFNKEPFPKM